MTFYVKSYLDASHFSQGDPQATPMAEQQHSLFNVNPFKLFSHCSVLSLTSLQHVPLRLSMQILPLTSKEVPSLHSHLYPPSKYSLEINVDNHLEFVSHSHVFGELSIRNNTHTLSRGG